MYACNAVEVVWVSVVLEVVVGELRLPVSWLLVKAIAWT